MPVQIQAFLWFLFSSEVFLPGRGGRVLRVFVLGEVSAGTVCREPPARLRFGGSVFDLNADCSVCFASPFLREKFRPSQSPALTPKARK